MRCIGISGLSSSMIKSLHPASGNEGKIRTVSVDVKQYWTGVTQELCEGRGGRPGLPVPNSPYGSVDVKQH